LPCEPIHVPSWRLKRDLETFEAERVLFALV